MEKEKLLQEARREFCHEFNAPPEECGYPVYDSWENTVIFAAGRKEADAFIRVQKMQWQSGKITVIAVVLVLVSIISLFGLIGFSFHSLDDIIMYMWGMLMILMVIFIGEIWKKVKSRRWKKIYRNKIYWYIPRLKHSAFSKM